jgi:hypothetical protein
VAALSRELGVDQATISRWRSGATQPVYIVPVTRVLRQLLDQPVPKRTYTRRRYLSGGYRAGIAPTHGQLTE